jgi:hypothetical protein
MIYDLKAVLSIGNQEPEIAPALKRRDAKNAQSTGN